MGSGFYFTGIWHQQKLALMKIKIFWPSSNKT